MKRRRSIHPSDRYWEAGGCFEANKGFSLVELLLALGLISTGVLALLQLMGPALNSLHATREAAAFDSIPATVALAAKASPWSVIFGEEADVVFFYLHGDGSDGRDGAVDSLLTSSDLANLLAAGTVLERRVFELRAQPVDLEGSLDRFVRVIEVRPLPPLGSGVDLESARARVRELQPAFAFPIKLARQ